MSNAMVLSDAPTEARSEQSYVLPSGQIVMWYPVRAHRSGDAWWFYLYGRNLLDPWGWPVKVQGPTVDEALDEYIDQLPLRITRAPVG